MSIVRDIVRPITDSIVKNLLGEVLTPLISDSLNNGGFESWSSATNAASWSESKTGSSTVNRESTDPNEGTYCCRIDIDGSNSYCAVQINSLVTAGDVIDYEFYARATGGNWKAGGDAGADATVIAPSTSWTKYTGRITIASSTKWIFSRNSSTSQSLYIDSVKVWKVT
jgi:hypothetical protein